MWTENTIGRIATIVTLSCVAIVVITVGALAMPAVRAKLGFAPPKAPNTTTYQVGDRLDVPASLYNSSDLTLVIFARSTCNVCQRAKPVFAELTTQIGKTPAARVVLVSGNSERPDEVAYGEELGLNKSQLVTVNLATLRLQFVPTLVLVNRQGDVKYTSEGVPSVDQQAALLRVVRSVEQPR